MIVDKNAALPLPAASSAGKGGNAAQTSPQDRTAWLKEMEKQEMTAWLSHSATLPGRAAPASPVVYARLSPPVMPADGPASASAPAAGTRSGERPAMPPTDSEARSGLHEGAGDGAGRSAVAEDGARYRGQPEEGCGDVADAAPGLVAFAGQAAPGVPAPADLVAAVMSALVQEQPAGTAAVQPLQLAVPIVPISKESGFVQPQQPAVTLLRPLDMPVPGGAQRSPQSGPNGEPALQGKQASETQGRRATAIAQSGTPGEALAPLRIHTASTASGVRIWIGADHAAGLSGQQLLLAAMDIRRLLREQGTPLASLIYNGESVFDGEDLPEASAPRPGPQTGIGPRKNIKT